MRPILVGCSLALCLLVFLKAQQQRENRPDNRGVQPGRQRQTQRPARHLRPLLVRGKVLLDDGSQPAQPVQILLSCQGSVVRQTYSSPGGSFSLEVSSSSPLHAQMPLDASISTHSWGERPGYSGRSGVFGGPGLGDLSGDGAVNLSGCEVKAVQPGFQSDVVHLGHRSPLDNPDVGVLVLHRLGEATGSTISATTLAAPEKARKAYQKAYQELSKAKPRLSRVSRELDKAVRIYPGFAAAWNLLGEVRLAEKDRPGARRAFERAIAEDARYVNPHLSLARMDIEAEQWEQAAGHTSQALELNSHIAAGHYFHAVAHFFLGEPETAEDSLRRLQENRENALAFPTGHYLLGWILAERRQFEEAAFQFRRFLELTADAELASRVEEQLARWSEAGVIARETGVASEVPAPEE